jgi:amino acid transporter
LHNIKISFDGRSLVAQKLQQDAKLKRALGLFEVTLSGLGIILGAGIYALISEATALAGNALWISFVIAAIVAIITGLSYAELASIFPKASAEFEYTAQAFNRSAAFIVGWLIIFSGAVGGATVALGFAGYFRAMFGGPLLLSAIILIALLSIILFLGITQSAMVAIVFTLIEAAGLIIIICLGIPHLGMVNYLETPIGYTGIFQAAALIFFSYLGFEEIVKLAEETKDPERNIPLGLILAVSASVILYISVAFSAVSVLGWEKLSQSQAPFAEIAAAVLGENAFGILSIIALFATANTVLLMLLAASRITYGMAESSSLPNILAQIHPRTRTPWVAILVTAALSTGFVLLEDIGYVAGVANFTVFITFIVINAALIVLRYKRTDLCRPFRVPIAFGRFPVLPLFGIIFNFFMLTQLSFQVLAVGTLLIISGAIAFLVLKVT